MVVDVSAYATQPVVDALSMVRVGGRVVLAGVKGFKAVEGFVSDLVVMKEITILGAIGVTATGYRSAIKLLESGKVEVKTRPKGATILVDGKKEGTTPEA